MRLGSCDGSRCARVVAGIRHWQTEVRSPPFRDIAYSFLICPGCGTVHVGRGWGVRTAANGTNAGNTGWHAAMVMSGEGEPFTDAAKSGLLALHGGHHRRYGRSRLTTHHAVRGGTTACPGPVIRRWVAAGAPSPDEEFTVKAEDEETIRRLIREEVGRSVAMYRLPANGTGDGLDGQTLQTAWRATFGDIRASQLRLRDVDRDFVTIREALRGLLKRAGANVKHDPPDVHGV